MDIREKLRRSQREIDEAAERERERNKPDWPLRIVGGLVITAWVVNIICFYIMLFRR